MRKSKHSNFSLYSRKKDSEYVKLYVPNKITFTDVLLVLMSVSIFFIIIKIKETNSSGFNLWIVILILLMLAFYFLLVVFLRHFQILTSNVFVLSKRKEVIVTRLFSKKVISFDEIMQFNILIIKKYGIYNSSGGLRGPDILVGIIEIKSARLGEFIIFETNPIIINNNESHLIGFLEKNCRDFIKEIGIPKTILWKGIKYERSN